jgi:eukaryotic-like serine/threonine-protein kinase
MDRAHEVVYETARFDTLRRLPFFAGFGDAELWETVRISTWTEHAVDEMICAEGSPGDRIYFVAKGEARVLRDGVVLNTLSAGDCFGEIAYIDDEQSVRSASVQASSPMLLIEIEAAALHESTASLQSAFNRAFMRLLVSRLKSADRRYLDAVLGRK